MPRIAAREAAFAALAERLAQAMPTTPVERNRRAKLSPQEDFPRLVLRDGGQNPLSDAVGEEAWSVSAVVEGYVSGPEQQAGPAASDLYARVAEALCSEAIIGAAGQMELYVSEGSLDFDVVAISDSAPMVAAFYLDLSFQLRLPAGLRFLDIP